MRPAALALTDTMSVSVAIVPDEGVTVTQGAFSVAVHALSLSLLLERTTVCGEGSVPPMVAEKVRALGLTCKAHDGLTKPRSNASVNAVPPSSIDIVCRVGAVRGSLIFIKEGTGAGWAVIEQRLCPDDLFRRASKRLAGIGEERSCRRKHTAGAI